MSTMPRCVLAFAPAVLLSSSCGIEQIHKGDNWCMLAIGAVGTHPNTGEELPVMKDAISSPQGCQCLHQDDSDLVFDVETGAVPPNQAYWNIRQRVQDNTLLSCLHAANTRYSVPLLNPTCEEVVSICNGLFQAGEATCAVEPNADSAWGSAGDTADECETDSWGGVGASTGEPVGEFCRGHVTNPEYPSDAGTAIQCSPRNQDDCLVDEYFVTVMNTDPSLIVSDPGSVEFVANGVKVSSAPAGSLAAALGFQAGDIIESVDGLAVSPIKEAMETYVRIAKERSNSTFEVEYTRSGRARVKTVSMTDLASYP